MSTGREVCIDATFIAPTVSAFASISATPADAALIDIASMSFFACFISLWRADIFAAISPSSLILRAERADFTVALSDFASAYAPIPEISSILLVPAATELSETSLTQPRLPVAKTCVPPQSSLEKSPIFTTRTVSPYFSPKSAIAPDFFADSRSVSTVVTGIFSRIFSFIMRSTLSSSSAVTAEKCVKSKRPLSASTMDPA